MVSDDKRIGRKWIDRSEIDKVHETLFRCLEQVEDYRKPLFGLRKLLAIKSLKNVNIVQVTASALSHYAVASQKLVMQKGDREEEEKGWAKKKRFALRPWPCKIHKHQIDYHLFQCDGQGERDLIYGHSSAGRCNLPFSSFNCFSVYIIRKHALAKFHRRTFRNKVNKFRH